MGEGWGGGSERRSSPTETRLPPPYPPPVRGRGTPREDWDQRWPSLKGDGVALGAAGLAAGALAWAAVSALTAIESCTSPCTSSASFFSSSSLARMSVRPSRVML